MKNNLAYKNLSLWEDSLDLVKYIYILTSVFPHDEKEGLVKAIKTQAIKIPSGIAKALQKDKNSERAEQFQLSIDALVEIETYFIIANKLDYMNEEDINKYNEKSQKVSMQIKTLKEKLRI